MFAIGCSKASFNPSRPGTVASGDASELMSKIEVTDNNIADGTTPAEVTLIVMSQSGAPVVGAEMSISVTGYENVIIPCTKTNELGRSRCKIYSTRSERKRITARGGITLSTDTWFHAPNPTRSSFAIVSSGSSEILPSGHLMITTGGVVESPSMQTDTNGAVRAHTSILGIFLNDQ